MRSWLLCAVAVVGVAGRAWADGTVRIAVVHEPAADARAMRRLRDELGALGFETVDRPERSDRPEVLEGAARATHAQAAVRVLPNRGGVEIWVAKRETGEAAFRGSVIGPGGVFDDVLALQAAEVVRATLIDLGFVPPPPPPAAKREAPPPPKPSRRREPAVPAAPSRPIRRFSLTLGPAVSATPRGPTPGFHAFAAARVRATRLIGFDALAGLPLTAPTIDAPEGSASVRSFLFGADAAVWLLPRTSSVEATAAGGVALTQLVIEGNPTPPSLGRDQTLTLALPFARIAVVWWVAARFGLGAEGLAGMAIPRPTIRFDGREAATWGRPLVIGALTAVMALE